MDNGLIINYGQFALSLGKETPYIFSKFNSLYTHTLLIWILSLGPSVFIVMGFLTVKVNFRFEYKINLPLQSRVNSNKLLCPQHSVLMKTNTCHLCQFKHPRIDSFNELIIRKLNMLVIANTKTSRGGWGDFLEVG